MINTSAQNTLKNSAYYAFGLILPVIILVFFTPIIISNLGVKEYGIYIFLNTVLTFLGLIDLGIGTATSKHVIEYYSSNQIDKLKKLLNSMNSIFLIQGLFYLIMCFCFGLIMFFFQIKVSSGINYPLLFLIIGGTGFVGSIFGNFVSLPITIQRQDIHIKIYSIFLILSNLSMLILVICGYKLVAILLSQLIFLLLSCLTYLFISKKIFKHLELKYEWDKKELIKNYKFALPVAFNNIASSSLVHFDKLLIPIFLGSAPLTYYSVPGSVAAKISQTSSSFSSLLFPITVNLHTLQNTDKIKRVYLRSVRLIAILSSAIAFSIIFVNDKILLYWLDESFVEQSSTVLILLVITNLILAIFSPLSNLLMAMGKMKFLTLSSFTMAIINIFALLILLPKYGINGAAWAYLISVLYIIGMFYYSEKKYFQLQEKDTVKLFTKITVTAIPFYFVVFFIINPLIKSMILLMIMGPICILIFMLLYKLFGFVEHEDWNDLKISSTKILHKLKIN
jgi:O-antigen/teichoic acid export membrane protein